MGSITDGWFKLGANGLSSCDCPECSKTDYWFKLGANGYVAGIMREPGFKDQLRFVVGVELGKEINFVVVAKEHAIVLRNTRLFTGAHLIKRNVKNGAILLLYMTLAPITVTSSTLWPEYEIISEDESAFDTDMSDDNGYANSLVPESRIDEYVKSLLESFEILPQLLYYFGVKNEVDSLDWATIVVYTCEASCDGSSAYKEEFVWVQLDSQSTTARR